MIRQKEGVAGHLLVVALDEAASLFEGDVAERRGNERDPKQPHDEGHPPPRQ